MGVENAPLANVRQSDADGLRLPRLQINHATVGGMGNVHSNGVLQPESQVSAERPRGDILRREREGDVPTFGTNDRRCAANQAAQVEDAAQIKWDFTQCIGRGSRSVRHDFSHAN
ncbi:hypothetical protein CLE01_25130 [Cryobacterium levicorallinum]|nr:hypothetical protein CLE01_25130 [Cryobacterium levicorallinum]